MPQLSLGTRLSAGGPLTSLPRRVAAILRKFGTDAHVWMPGPGVPVLGPELISNGDFSNGTAGWVITGGSAPYGVSAVGGELSFSGSASWVNVRKLDVLTIGKTYQCTYTVKSRSAGSVRFNGGGFLGTFRTAPGTYTEVFTATEHGHFSMQHGGDLVATIDDVSVKELLGYSTLLNGFQAANYLEANASGAPQVVDQPVGYVGDAANVTLGAELNPQPNLDAQGGWILQQPTSGSVTISGGKLRINSADGSNCGARLDGVITAGKTYEFVLTVTDYVSGTGGFSFDGGATNHFAITANGTFTFRAVAQNTGFLIKRFSACDFRIDTLSIKEIIGAIPATQATTANKPILRRGHVNRIRNSTMQGAVVGTPGTLPTNWAVNVSAGLSTHVVAKWVEDGLDYIDLRIFGTASGSTWNMHFDSVTAIDTVVGTNWTAAVNVRMVGGSAAGITAIGTCPRFGQSAGTVTNATPALVALTSSYSRLTRTDTGAANTAKITQRLDMNITNGAAIDVTIRIAAPQLETGSVANAFVPTTTAAASSNTGGYWWEFGMEATPNDTLTMAAPLFQVNDDMAVITGVTMNGLTSHARIFSQWGAGASFFRLYVEQTTRKVFAAWNDDSAAGVVSASPGTLDYGVPAVFSAVKSGGGRYVRKDGVAGNTAGNVLSGASSLTSAAICSQAGGAYFVGSVFSTIAIKGTVSGADLKILEKWVGQQAGVTIT